MARRLINGRFRDVDQPGVLDLSRLLVVGYLIAIAIGLVLCLIWMAVRLTASWW